MIRIAEAEDLEAIVGIYNQAIDARFQTAFTERITVAERQQWFSEHTADQYPLFVYTIKSQVVGWLSISPYRAGRAALRYCIEVSYFIDTDHQQKGIGTQLLEHAINACKELNYRQMLAIILDKNEGSIRLMKKGGFEEWGRLPGIADFDGAVCGHVYYGKTL